MQRGAEYAHDYYSSNACFNPLEIGSYAKENNISLEGYTFEESFNPLEIGSYAKFK